jgi:RND family efflux transporter MFP subunit
MSISVLNVQLPRPARRLAAAASIAASLFITAACGSSSDAAGGPPGAGGRGGPAMAVPVELLTLAERPVDQTSEFVGTVRSRRSVTVQPQVEGFIKRILVKSGDRVKAGAVLVEIDDASQLAIVANLESVKAARESDATFARQQAERARKLLATGAISQQEHDQAMALQRSTEAQLKAVEEQIRQQKNEWSYTRVTAAAGGVVGDVPVRVGDRVTRQTLITTVEDNSNLELYVNVPVHEAPRLKLGLTVQVLNDEGAVAATERINFISPSVDDATQTVLVKTPIASRGGALRTDQSVRARIVWSTAPAVTVPLVAVSRISGQYFVFVAEPGESGGLVARQRPVTVGPVVGNDYVVMSGLKAGDKVIVAGVQKIGDGAPVAPGPPGGRGGPPNGRGGN